MKLKYNKLRLCDFVTRFIYCIFIYLYSFYMYFNLRLFVKTNKYNKF